MAAASNLTFAIREIIEDFGKQYATQGPTFAGFLG